MDDRLERAREAAPTTSPTGVADLERASPRGLTELQAVTSLDGEDAFARVGAALGRWDLHRAAGMVLAADGPPTTVATTVVNVGLLGSLGVVAPCRTTVRVDEANRRGFVYATLPGHPLVGEELFVVERVGEAARLRIRSFSRPAGLGRAAPALSRAGQQVVNARYLAAARRLAAAPAPRTTDLEPAVAGVP